MTGTRNTGTRILGNILHGQTTSLIPQMFTGEKAKAKVRKAKEKEKVVKAE